MNEHTKFYLHNINETYEFNGWLLEFVSGELDFRRNSTSNATVLMGLFVLSHRPSFRLCLLVVL